MTSNPFPRVKAFQLKDPDFNRILRLLKCEEDELRELEEWHRILSTEGTDACIFNAEEMAGFDYIILIRETPYHSIRKILRHELSHIVRGDI